MTHSIKPGPEDRIDRYVRGELTAAEARKLAQESLDAPELFEELTYSALAKSALSTRTASDRKIVRFPWKARFAVAGTAAAAAVLVVLYQPSPVPNQSHETAARSYPKPTIEFSADPGQPVLLAQGLQPDPAGRDAQVFRGAAPDTRSPQPAGAIVSIEDGLATIDLGSLDGVAKGSELPVYRDAQSTQPVGRFIATTVFRERARGRISGAQQIQVSGRVRVAGDAHLAALLEQVDALSSQGDSAAARGAAEKAAGWADSANVPADDRRKALLRLAALEYQAGSLQAAETHYRSAADITSSEPAASSREQSAAWNNLAVLHMLRGDYDGAEAPLSHAVSTSPKTNIAYGRSVNNLGVLAELRGDRRKAEALYADAQRAFAGVADSPARERRVVEANLTRIRGLR